MIDISDLIKIDESRHGVPYDEQFSACHAVWAEHQGTLKVIFRFFCMQSAAGSVECMQFDALLALCKATGVLGKELTKTELQVRSALLMSPSSPPELLPPRLVASRPTPELHSLPRLPTTPHLVPHSSLLSLPHSFS